MTDLLVLLSYSLAFTVSGWVLCRFYQHWSGSGPRWGDG